MPYYYAFFLKMFGISMQSVLWGQILLFFLSGLVVYLILVRYLPAFLSALTAAFFWTTSSFDHTYNHVGGAFFNLLGLWMLARYIQLPKKSYLALGTACLIFFNLIYLPAGTAASIGFILSGCLIDRFKKNNHLKFILLCGLINLAVTALIYAGLFCKIPQEILHGYFSTKGALDQYPITLKALWPALKGLGTGLFYTQRPSLIDQALPYLCLAAVIKLLFFRGRSFTVKKEVLLFLASLLIMALIVLNLYLLTCVPYRFNWARYLFTFSSVTILYLWFKDFALLAKIGLTLLLAGSFFLEAGGDISRLPKFKGPQNFWGHPRVNIYTPEAQRQSIDQIVQFIDTEIPKGEKILPIPYGNLYLFLTDRQSGLYENIFFKFNRLSTHREQKIIQEIEDKKIDWILLSSRYADPEVGLGIFGTTHCKELAKYIGANFKVVATLGGDEESGTWDVKMFKKSD